MQLAGPMMLPFCCVTACASCENVWDQWSGFVLVLPCWCGCGLTQPAVVSAQRPLHLSRVHHVHT